MKKLIWPILLLAIMWSTQAQAQRIVYNDNWEEALVAENGDTIIPFSYNIDETTFKRYYLVDLGWYGPYRFINKETLKPIAALDSIYDYSKLGREGFVRYEIAVPWDDEEDDYGYYYNDYYYGVYDIKNDKEILPADYEYIYDCGEDLLLVTQSYNEKAIYSLESKSFTTEFIYTEFSCYEEDGIILASLAPDADRKSSGGEEIFDATTGKRLVDELFKSVEHLYEGYLKLETGEGGTGLFNLEAKEFVVGPGKYTIDDIFVRGQYYEDPYYIIGKDEKYGLFDPNTNSMVMDIMYDKIERGIDNYSGDVPLIIGNEGDVKLYNGRSLKPISESYYDIEVARTEDNYYYDDYYGYYDYYGYDYGYYDYYGYDYGYYDDYYGYYNDYYGYYGDYYGYYGDYYGYYGDYYDYYDYYGTSYYNIFQKKGDDILAGLMDDEFNIILEPEYDEVNTVDYSLFSYRKGNTCGVYDSYVDEHINTGQYLITGGSPLWEFLLATKDEKVGLANAEDYSIVLEPKYVEITKYAASKTSYASDVFVVVEKEGDEDTEVAYFMTMDMKLLDDQEIKYISSINWSEPYYYSYSYSNDYWDQTYGIMDSAFNKLSGPDYTSVYSTYGSDNYAKVTDLRGNSGIYSYEKAAVVYTSDKEVELIGDNTLVEINGDGYYYSGYYEDAVLYDLKTGAPMFKGQQFDYVSDVEMYDYWTTGPKGIFEYRFGSTYDDYGYREGGEQGFLSATSGVMVNIEDEDYLPSFEDFEDGKYYIARSDGSVYYSGYDDWGYYQYEYFPYTSYLFNGKFELKQELEYTIVTPTENPSMFLVKEADVESEESEWGGDYYTANGYTTCMLDINTGKRYFEDYNGIEAFGNYFFTKKTEGGNWKLVDLKGKEKTKDSYDEIRVVSGTDRVLVSVDGLWGVMNTSLKYELKPTYSYLEVLTDDYYYYDYDWYYYDYDYGYDDETSVAGGYGYKGTLNGDYYFLDNDFVEKAGPFDYAYQDRNTWWKVEAGSYDGILDVETMELIIPVKYDYIYYLYTEEGYYHVSDGDYSGVYSAVDKRFILPMEYDDITSDYSYTTYETTYLVTKDGLVGLYDNEFNLILPHEYYSIDELDGTDYYAVENARGQVLLIDVDGNVILDAKYDAIANVHEVDDSDYYDYYDYYYDIESLEGRFYMVTTGDYWGILDSAFNELLPTEYRSLSVIEYNYDNYSYWDDYYGSPKYMEISNKDGFSGMVNQDFKWLIEPKYNTVWVDQTTGLWMGILEDAVYVISPEGKHTKIGVVDEDYYTPEDYDNYWGNSWDNW